MLRRPLSAVTAVWLSLVVLVIGVAPAIAAPVSLTESTLFVQLYPEEQPDSASMVAYVTIPSDTPLPATIRIPIPEGGQPFWVGEVFGRELNDEVDQEREYAIVEGDGGKVVEFTLEETRTAMYEATTGAIGAQSGRYSVVWNWTQSETVGDVQFSITLPPTATLVQIEPPPFGSPQAVEGGRQMFFLSPAHLASGETTTIAVSYSRAEPTLPEVETPGYQGPVPLWLLLILGVAIVLLIAVVLRERGRRDAAADAGVDYDADEDA